MIRYLIAVTLVFTPCAASEVERSVATEQDCMAVHGAWNGSTRVCVWVPTPAGNYCPIGHICDEPTQLDRIEALLRQLIDHEKGDHR